jgi:hypothetical protein
MGFEVIDPMDRITGDKDWFESSAEALKYMLECNAIFILNDWKNSPIARLSFYVAASLQFDIFTENDTNWLKTISQQGRISEITSPRFNKITVEKWLTNRITASKDALTIADATNFNKRYKLLTDDLRIYEMILGAINKLETVS